MPWHNITRDFRRSFFNLLGVVFSIMLILVALATLDWINSILDFQYEKMIRYDADVNFASAGGAGAGGRPLPRGGSGPGGALRHDPVPLRGRSGRSSARGWSR